MTGIASSLRRSWAFTPTKIGVALTSLVLFVAFLGPLFAPHSASGFAGPPFSSASSAAPLGTDFLGHDVLSEVLHGGVFVVWSAIAAATVAMAIGVGLGLLAGYAGGAADSFTMRGFDLILAFPQLVLVLLFVSLLGPKPWLIVLLTGVALAPGVARVTRGLTKDVSRREFVTAAALLGVPRRTIVFSEVLPNLSSALLVEFTTRLIWAIAMIAGLSFLGLGPNTGGADWGLMINQNRNGLTLAPLAVVVPVALIALFAIGIGLIAEGVGRGIARIDAASERA